MATGGAERVATTMANAWSAQGRKVWLVSTYLDGRASGYALHPEVSTVFLSDMLAGPKLARGFTALRKVFALRRVLRAIAPDAVVSFLTNVNVLTIAALAGSGFPVIVSERTDPAADVELHRLFRFARARAYRFADALVVQTAAAARRYSARLHRLPDIEIIPNPLPSDLAASPLRARQDGSGGRVIALGRLTPEKGFASLIAAFDKALGSNASWELQIWGDGPLRSVLTRLVGKLHLEGRVELCGATTQPWAALAAAQIFVLSSEYEGFPNAMLEAMAVGLPCIAFDCPSGPQELADGGATAIIVPPGDVDALARALRNLAADREARQILGERAAAFVRHRFAEDRVMGDWDRLIGRLLPPDGKVGDGVRGTRQ
jgi:GalNAc-alpha-(1->4)-GalNAc-alpha-(1->3)-diNAcBac-PP-undecaprenol alpha-1,4-N-acetyl-D-galactosaminyltransferase